MSTSSTSSSTSFTPLQFTGISQYSSDFQQILNRAVSIAQIPLMQIQNQQSLIQQEQASLSTLGAAATSVVTALQQIGQLGSGGALSATSTDQQVVTANNTGASEPTSFAITNVTSLASPASETSRAGYGNATSIAVSTTGSMQLVYGSHTYPITLGAGKNNLQGLRDAVNNLGAGVTATILTAGAQDYLSVSSNSPGATTLKVVDDPSGAATNFLTSNNQGTNTNFLLNQIPISSPSTTVNSVIPGVTLNFTGTTAASETVSVKLATDRGQIVSALQSLVSSYNTLATAEGQQFGTTAGPLSGNSIIYQLRQAMSSIVQYQGTGSIGNLANLGIEMSQNGQMSLNQQNFNSLSDAQITSGLQLLGSSTTGIGGLQKTFGAITDPLTGSIASQQHQWSTTSTSLSNQIGTLTQHIRALEQSTNQRLQAADALIARLQSQQNILNASITSLDYTSYGYNTSATTSKST